MLHSSERESEIGTGLGTSGVPLGPEAAVVKGVTGVVLPESETNARVASPGTLGSSCRVGDMCAVSTGVNLGLKVM
jgi:hypothetical protein